VSKSEELAERVIQQPDDKFKNKKQVLFHSNEPILKHMLTPNQITNKILEYLFYNDEVRPFLRLISRTAFIMSFDESVFSPFPTRSIELPYTNKNSLIYVCPQLQKQLKVSTKVKELNKDFQDVAILKLCDKVANIH
jgi:hypothetical protein